MERLTAQSRAIVRIHRTTLASGHNLGLQCPSPEKRDPSNDRVPVSSFQAMSYIASLQNCHFLGWVARNLVQTCHGRRTNRRSLVEVSCPLPLAGKYHCQGRRKGRNPSRLSQKARLLLQRHSCRPAHEVQEIESEEEDQSYRRKTGDSDSRWPIWSRFFSTSLCSGVRLLRKGKGDPLSLSLSLSLTSMNLIVAGLHGKKTMNNITIVWYGCGTTSASSDDARDNYRKSIVEMKAELSTARNLYPMCRCSRGNCSMREMQW